MIKISNYIKKISKKKHIEKREVLTISGEVLEAEDEDIGRKMRGHCFRVLVATSRGSKKYRESRKEKTED